MDVELVGAICGSLAALGACAMAGFVYVVAPSRAQNRLTAVFLLLTAAQVWFTFGPVWIWEWPLGPVQAVAMTAAVAQSFVYLALVGTLDAPSSRVFGTPRARVALLVLAGAAFAAWPLYRGAVLEPEGRERAGYWALLFAHAVALLYGVLVAVSVWRRAPRGSVARERGRAFALAFGVRDVVFVVFISVAVVLVALTVDLDEPWTIAWTDAQNIIVPLSVLAMVLLMGYGMAKAHLFEVDIKVKAGVRRGSIAAVFLLVFLVVSQLVEGLSSQTFGLVGGALASGVLLLALAPLQRAAERLSTAVVPDVRPLASRSADERAQLYREQVRIAWEDGHMGLKERRMLDAARERLGLSAEHAQTLEGEVVRALSPTAAA